MHDELIKELAQFDRNGASVKSIIQYIQDNLPQPHKSLVTTISIFRKAFGTSIKEAIGIVDLGSHWEITVDEAIEKIRKMGDHSNGE